MRISISGQNTDGSSTQIYAAKPVSTNGNTGYFKNIDAVLDVHNFQTVTISIASVYYKWTLNAYIEIRGDYPNMDVIYPSLFPVAKNLPDMTQGD